MAEKKQTLWDRVKESQNPMKTLSEEIEKLSKEIEKLSKKGK